MSIHRKKSAVINNQVRIRNELSQVFVPTNNNNNNLGISINTTVPVNYTNTISTSISNIDSNTAYGIGQNWVDSSTGIISVTLYSVCWSSELKLFCITGNEWVFVSNDGLSWRSTFIGASPGLHFMNSVCWSAELLIFCTVADNANYAAVSSNGTTWTAATSVPSGIWKSVCWSPELRLFCAVASSGTGNDQVMISTNGTSWSSSNVSNVVNNAWVSVCWAHELGLFCAVANSGNTNQRVMISNNGLNWNNANTGVLSNNWNSVCWAGELGLFCAVAITGTTNQRVMVSNDGLNWSNAITGVLNNQFASVCWARELGLFCAVAITGTTNQRVMVSRDGLNWNSGTSGVLNYQFPSVCWSPELSSFLSISSYNANNGYAMITNPNYRVSITPIKTQNNNYIPLVSSNGTSELKTKTSISYNINKNTLNLVNLSTINPPSCSATPVNSNDLINKTYLNSFVGDYTQGWIYDDWITGDASGSLNWVIDSSNNTSMLSSDASGHIGIIRLTRTFQNFTSLKPNNSITFDSSTNITVRFLIRPFSNNSAEYTQIRLSLSAYNVDYSANSANMASWVFDTSGVAGGTNTKWQCMINSNNSVASYTYGASENSLRNKWVLFEIELNNKKPSFYITVIGETNRTLVYQQTTAANASTIASGVQLVPHILILSGSASSTTILDVDYIDIKYDNMSRR